MLRRKLQSVLELRPVQSVRGEESWVFAMRVGNDRAQHIARRGWSEEEERPECVSRRQCGEATWELRPPNGRLLPRSSRAAQSSFSPAPARRPRRHPRLQDAGVWRSLPLLSTTTFAFALLLPRVFCTTHGSHCASHLFPPKRSSQNSRPEQGKPTLFVTSSSHHAGPASHATQHASCISPPRPTQVGRIPSPLSLFAHAMPARRQISQHRRYLHAIASRARRPPPQRMFARPRRVAPPRK